MSNSRLETLKSMVAQDPKGTFARYGLAMEYANTGNLELAIQEYRNLLTMDPNYAAAYYHGGQALEKVGRTEEARQIYQQGIVVTARTGDLHTQSEIQAALDILG
jgi:Tfp pilus assembly protein PilF